VAVAGDVVRIKDVGGVDARFSSFITSAAECNRECSWGSYGCRDGEPRKGELFNLPKAIYPW